MCGLVGMAGDINKKEKQAFDLLLMLDEKRGPHSTGVLSVNNSDHKVVKRAMPAYDFIDSKGYNKIMSATTRVLLGHNRWATQGAINSENAHPFHHGHIIGAHNGTLKNQSLLVDSRDFEVDSENLIHSLNEVGVHSTWGSLSGAAALVWWDTDTNQINMMRNSERPLSYTTSKDGKSLFWASERLMLSYALLDCDVPHEDITTLPTDKHYRWQLDGYKLKDAKPEIADVEPYKLPVSTYVKPNLPKKGAAPVKKFIPSQSHPLPLLNESLEFFVWSRGGNYFNAFEVDGVIPVKIYHNGNKKIIDMLFPDGVLSPDVFEGTVVRIDTGGDYIINPLSVQPVYEIEGFDDEAKEDEEAEEMYELYEGIMVSKNEWVRGTMDGCHQCGVMPAPHESDSLLWLSAYEYYCSTCQLMIKGWQQ
jgi:predicted glutamine amidotransferase